MILKTKKLTILCVLTLFSTGLVGCGGSGTGLNPEIAGVAGPDVEMVDGKFILSMAFENINFDGGLTVPVPKYPNSSLSVGPDFESDGMLIVFTVAIEDFVNINDRYMDPQTLPGGRPLPGVASGALPALALKIPEVLNSVFYVGPKVMGFFVPFNKLDLKGGILTFRFHDKDGVRVGNISLVGEDQVGTNAGLLVLINIDNRIQTSINSHMASL